MMLFEIGRLRQLVDIALVGAVHHGPGHLRVRYLTRVQVAGAQCVRLLVRQLHAVVLRVLVAAALHLPRLVQDMVLQLERGSSGLPVPL